jgi:cyclic pyranopterin phosphate synthase
MSKSTAKAFLHEKHFSYLKDFIARSGDLFSVNIIGGEPLLYMNLDKLLEELFSLPNLSQVCIFTGGIASEKLFRKLLHFNTSKLGFLFNINEKKDYKTQKEYELVLRNFDLVLSYGFKATFGYNIYEVCFDYMEILDLCDKYGTNVLRWTIAFPELKPSNLTLTLKPNDYQFVAPKVSDFLEAAYQRGIHANLDCPLPKCFFTKEQLGRLALTQPHTINTIRACGPVIDVSPDLDVFRCYALSDLKRTKLTDFHNFQEAVDYYQKNIDDMYDTPQTFDYCYTCEFALNQTCFGGCIAHSPKAIDMRVSKEDLIKLMYQALHHNNIQEVESIFEIHKYELRGNSFANYIMSFVAEYKNDIETAKSYLRKSIINASTQHNTLFVKRFRELS